MFDRQSVLAVFAVILGSITGYYGWPEGTAGAKVVSEVFINLLKLVSLPIIFLSIVSTATGMESLAEAKRIGGRVVRLTVLTTVIAAAVALILFIVVDPVRSVIESNVPLPEISGGYFHHLIQTVPANIVEPFLNNNVIGVLFIAMLLSVASLTLEEEPRKTLHTFFSALYAAVMTVTRWIISLMPLAVWAFVTLFFHDLQEGLEVESLMYYLAVVVFANLVQAIIVLPILLRSRGIRPLKLFRAMLPALSVAFFGKSSSAALPAAISCASEQGGVSKKVAGFTLPLCTTINMNACAAFILTTVLFVSMSNGVIFSPVEMVLWIFVATVAAIGNAGVPMGCYFMSSAFLAAMGVPLNILGVILPFYGLIDMLESAINVWSDSCVAACVDAELEPVEVVA